MFVRNELVNDKFNVTRNVGDDFYQLSLDFFNDGTTELIMEIDVVEFEDELLEN